MSHGYDMQVEKGRTLGEHVHPVYAILPAVGPCF